MNATRKIAINAGVIFIIATAAAIVSSALVPGVNGNDYFFQFSAHVNQVAVAAVLNIISAFTSVGIAISLYPLLKKLNVGLAIGSVVLRTIEAVFYLAGVVGLLSLLTLSQGFATAGVTDQASFQVVGDLLLSLRNHASLIGVFAFSLGAFMYYCIFFQSRLIPRWLSGWGIVAIILIMVACMLSLFSDKQITSYIPLAAPIGLQEMVLAIWLIVKGFNPTATEAMH